MAIKTYLKELQGNLSRGNATEHTHRPALKGLIEVLNKDVTATNEPSRIKCGAPDFIVSRKDLPLGYIEAKDVGKSLDEVEKTGQLSRYLNSLHNLILTDYVEFRWYVDGEHRTTARLGATTKEKKIISKKEDAESVESLLMDFMAHVSPPAVTAKELALRMARLAQMIRDLIIETFRQESETGTLHGQFTAFREALIPDLDEVQFADMYAQTISYGLFAARCNQNGEKKFTRQNAAYLLPKTNPFLRKLFGHIAGPDLDDRIAWLVDDLAQLLDIADMHEILRDFGRRTKREDPVVHFYETFLAAYDPKMREMRGVYYTPEPVVSYIVRSIDRLLRLRFHRPDSLADKNTLILDPAGGTATFLYDTIKLIHQILEEQGQLGMWDEYVEKCLLRRIFGFELLMAPYAVAHLKLGLLLQETGYKFASDQRLGIYLTNTLEEGIKKSEALGFAEFITAEGNEAARIKKDEPIEIVLGNPPYSGHSANRSEMTKEVGKGQRYTKWVAGVRKELTATKDMSVKVKTFIGRLIEDYKLVDGKPLGEKNPKWLQDDYVKFIRFGQWRINKTGQGVMGYITNHSYLDNPTFRGMRQSLMNTFTDIYILNLHGNAKKKERCPDGSKDENVFDIQQGVAVALFIKEKDGTTPAGVHYADLWGLEKKKRHILAESDVTTTEWTELSPKSPFYLFVPREEALLDEYEQGWKVTDIFPVNSVGIVTARDHLTIKWTPEDVLSTILNFSKMDSESARRDYDLGKDARDWKVKLAQEDLLKSGLNKKKVVPILYRPFDIRSTYYTGKSRGFHCMPRPAVMRHMLAGENVCLITVRQVAEGIFDHALVTNAVVESRITLSNKGIGFVFPLYLYPVPDRLIAHIGPWPAGKEGRIPNLNPKFVADVEKRINLKFIPDGTGDLKKTFGPEDVFNYAYATLHSPTYRQRYAEFMKMDFPRLPLTSDRKLFKALADKGAELVSLHLMESPKLDRLITRYPVSGDNTIEKGYPQYVAPGEIAPGEQGPLKKGRVYINKEQYFEGISPEVWNFHVGGYQVLNKWLKESKKRKDSKLSYDNSAHFQRIVVAVEETIRLMDKIDKLIPEWPLQ